MDPSPKFMSGKYCVINNDEQVAESVEEVHIEMNQEVRPDNLLDQTSDCSDIVE